MRLTDILGRKTDISARKTEKCRFSICLTTKLWHNREVRRFILMGIPINREHSKMTRIDNRAAELGLCNLSALEQNI